MPSLAVIVPCFNEHKRLNASAFTEFIKANNAFTFFFVNDGSTDGTKVVLETIFERNPNQVHLVHLQENTGKGEAIRQGIIASSKMAFDYTAFIDADLSTPATEFIRLYQLLNINTEVLFASRIKKAGSVIKRSAFRHVTGRLIATIIDGHFNLGIYDTQCGTKFFKTYLLRNIIEKPFITTWFFDVEIFLRLRNNFPQIAWHEEPLRYWKDDGQSKLSILSGFKVCRELAALLKHY